MNPKKVSRKRNKIILIIFLILVLLSITVTSFAYWERLPIKDDVSVAIGLDRNIEIENVVNFPEQKKLIPLGAVKGQNDVDSIVLIFNVYLDFVPVIDLKLSVIATNILIDNKQISNDIFKIDIISPELINNNKSEVKIIISLLETLSQDQLKNINNQIVKFTLIFSAEQ